MKVRNLIEEEIFGNNKLNIFKEESKGRDISFQITDFCKYITKENLAHLYYIDSSNRVLKSNECITTNESNVIVREDSREFEVGIKPVIEYTDEELDVDSLPRMFKNGIEYVKFGFFPQSKIDDETVNKEYMDMESIYLPDNVTFSTNKLTCRNKLYRYFGLYKHHVLINPLKKELYIKCKIEYSGLFSEPIKNDDISWFKVEPIEWIIDREKHLLISKNILMRGIQYETDRQNVNSNDKFTLNDYLNDIFLLEILSLQPNMKKEKGIPKDKRVAKKYKQINFDLTEITEEDMIQGAINSNIPVFLHGKSGDGKSDRIKQVDPDCTIIYMRNMTPESLIGKTIVVNNELVDIPPTWYLNIVDKCQKEPEKIHILFFDELTNALPSIQSMAFNIVLNREINGKWKLPSNVRIVAAGNELEDSLAAHELVEPLYGRFLHVYINTDAKSWIKWAINKNIHPLIIAYISSFRDKVLRTKYTGETPNADPRKWEMASKVLYQTKNLEMLRELIGDSLTTEFINFCLSDVITLDDVLIHNYDSFLVPKMNISIKYATIVGLLHADMNQIDEVYNFVSMMGSEAKKLFEVLWSKDNPEKLEYLLMKNQEKIKTKKVI